MFVRKEASAQERLGIPTDRDPGGRLSDKGSLDSKIDLQRKLRSTFSKLMEKTGVNKMEDFIKVEVSPKLDSRRSINL